MNPFDIAPSGKDNSEDAEQMALMHAIEHGASEYPLACLIAAVPNGGHRHIRTAVNLKATGVRPGFPDLILPVAAGGFHGLFIEMKRTKLKPKRDGSRGGMSEDQIWWQNELQFQGYLAVTCYGWEEAWTVIRGYLDDKVNIQ